MRTRYLFAAILAVATINATAAPKKKDVKKTIYHEGWIDFNKNGVMDVYEDQSRSVDERVADLLSQMTVEEKSCQLATIYGYGRVLKDSLPTQEWKERIWKDGIANMDEQLNGVGRGYSTAYDLIYPFSHHVAALHKIQKWFVEETRLGIPVEFSNEGIHGLNHTLATPLPAPIAMGSTWDKNLVREAGRIAGYEARLLGYHSVYAPILDVARDQRWGRTLECYGEDPFLVGTLGAQMSSGIQENVASGLKHYAAYGVPKGGRDGNCRTDPHITPRELQELFLYPFKKVIRESHPMVVMSSYNDWNGEPVSASHWFLTELLREEFGFDGYVVSDSEAVEFVYTKHHVASDYEDAVRQVLEAGLNVRTHFTKPEDFIIPVRKLLADGRLSMDVVDKRVSEVLAVKFRMGLFDNPYTGDGAKADLQAGADKHLDFVHRNAAESIVLLKNEDSFLPLDKSKLNRILVTGPLADESNYMSSRYGPNGLPPTSMLKGLREYLEGSGVTVDYAKGCEVVDDRWPDSEIIPTPLTDKEMAGIQEAVGKAAEADVVIAVMGEDEFRTGESRSRSSLDLPGRQRQLLMELHKTGKPVVLILVNGQPLTINWENAYLPAIVETWFQSFKGGEIVAQMLFGDINPSGKLPVTFPKTIGQIEYNFPFKKGSHNDQPESGPNGQGCTRVIGALYPFGYGLSYTTFAYSDLKTARTDDGFEIRATVANTGRMEGDEIVQLYVRDKVSSVVTYDSVLRGFERVSLKPGESREVVFKLGIDDLKILDKQMKWTAEPGDFDVMVGASSEDIRLSGLITL